MAARLRLLQVSAADASPDQRRDFLREAVADALKGMPAARRELCLEALAERFPDGVPGAAAPAAGGEPTPEEHVSRLAALASKLSPEAKAGLAQKLAGLGLLASTPAPAVAPVPETATMALQMAFGLARPPRLDRVTYLLSALFDLLEKVDEVACKTFQNLPARDDFKTVNTGELRDALKGFLEADGEADVSGLIPPLQKVMERHRRGMVALLASLVGTRNAPGAGREFAKWYLDLFSPQNIGDVVGSTKGWLSGLKRDAPERCWEQYTQRFREDLSTPEHIDKKIKDAVANTVERIFQMKS